MRNLSNETFEDAEIPFENESEDDIENSEDEISVNENNPSEILYDDEENEIDTDIEGGENDLGSAILNFEILTSES